jgi:transposase InsO family protein
MDWLAAPTRHNNMKSVFGRPGKPTANAFIESFNGRLWCGFDSRLGGVPNLSQPDPQRIFRLSDPRKIDDLPYR